MDWGLLFSFNYIYLYLLGPKALIKKVYRGEKLHLE